MTNDAYRLNLLSWLNSRYGKISPQYQWWYRKTFKNDPDKIPSTKELQEILVIMDRYLMADTMKKSPRRRYVR